MKRKYLPNDHWTKADEVFICVMTVVAMIAIYFLKG